MSKWSAIRERLGATGPVDAVAAEIAIRRELRRLAVEAFIDAHYDVGCDGAMELDWFEKHPADARAVVDALSWSDDR